MRRYACLVILYSYSFPFQLHDIGSGLGLNHDAGINLTLVGCFWLGPPWLNRGVIFSSGYHLVVSPFLFFITLCLFA